LKYFLKNILVWFLYFNISLFSRRKENLSYSRILILAPHPDDEIFGLGGFILSQLERRSKINIIYLTDGEGSGVWNDKEEIRKQRIALSEEVCASLNINNADIYRLHLPDGCVQHRGQPGFDEAVKLVKGTINSVRPDVLFATHTLDYWPYDHVACAQIAGEAVNLSEHKPQLWYYWVWAWYNLKPWQLLKLRFNQFNRIDISGQIKKKRALMDIYLNSLTPDGKSWSGILPKPLLKAFNFPVEVVEKIS
jgi:LmbE family N-acetylglucosaminyl deacetylase